MTIIHTIQEALTWHLTELRRLRNSVFVAVLATLGLILAGGIAGAYGFYQKLVALDVAMPIGMGIFFWLEWRRAVIGIELETLFNRQPATSPVRDERIAHIIIESAKKYLQLAAGVVCVLMMIGFAEVWLPVDERPEVAFMVFLGCIGLAIFYGVWDQSGSRRIKKLVLVIFAIHVLVSLGCWLYPSDASWRTVFDKQTIFSSSWWTPYATILRFLAVAVAAILIILAMREKRQVAAAGTKTAVVLSWFTQKVALAVLVLLVGLGLMWGHNWITSRPATSFTPRQIAVEAWREDVVIQPTDTKWKLVSRPILAKSESVLEYREGLTGERAGNGLPVALCDVETNLATFNAETSEWKYENVRWPCQNGEPTMGSFPLPEKPGLSDLRLLVQERSRDKVARAVFTVRVTPQAKS
ncbi:MAG: hypothetical protein HY220_02280 [Candidatus Sungbacteria bacterium]|uniref:Uncharacterized protein n=1 Tax=Candidatus Sungiibacteriota bacterium TaxID=2750080 RepID=A0A9D6LN54_9BACT|nr:hypothetical protein [Candidatus Sungbacteria bacterium]